MCNQYRQYQLSARRVAAINTAFMELVNCEENPLTRADLERNIQRRPELWARFSGFLDVLPDKPPELGS